MSTPAPSNPPRTVQCYHCQRGFDVPGAAMSISCPWCYRRVTLDDLIVKDTCWTSRVQTCGRLTVHKRASLVASLIEARSGMTILGVCEGRLVSGGPVSLGPKAHVKGDLEAPSINIAHGATIEGGFFKILSPKTQSGVKSAGFVRPPPSTSAFAQSGGGARAGLVLPPSPMPRGLEIAPIRASVRVPDWIKRALRATTSSPHRV